ncbi:hypothetical protein KC349_g1259 [Hortaea werneckii]|nr:hypothetical protein KC349_g1259 [Hortaea werneckii]
MAHMNSPRAWSRNYQAEQFSNSCRQALKDARRAPKMTEWEERLYILLKEFVGRADTVAPGGMERILGSLCQSIVQYDPFERIAEAQDETLRAVERAKTLERRANEAEERAAKFQAQADATDTELREHFSTTQQKDIEISELKSTAQRLRAQRSQLKKEHQEKDQAMGRCESTINDCQRQIADLEEIAERQRNDFDMESAQHQEQVNKAERERDEVISQALHTETETLSKLQNERSKSQDLDSALKEAKSQLHHECHRTKELVAQANEIAQKLASAQHQQQLLSDEAQLQRQEVGRRQEAIGHAEERAKDLENTLSKATTRHDAETNELKSKILDADSKIGSLEGDVRQAREQTSRAKHERQELSAELSKAKNGMQLARQEHQRRSRYEEMMQGLVSILIIGADSKDMSAEEAYTTLGRWIKNQHHLNNAALTALRGANGRIRSLARDRERLAGMLAKALLTANEVVDASEEMLQYDESGAGFLAVMPTREAAQTLGQLRRRLVGQLRLLGSSDADSGRSSDSWAAQTTARGTAQTLEQLRRRLSLDSRSWTTQITTQKTAQTLEQLMANSTRRELGREWYRESLLSLSSARSGIASRS